MPVYDCGAEDCLTCIDQFRAPKDDLIERLRNPSWADCTHDGDMEEAADRIESLEAALRPFAEYGAVLLGQRTGGENVLIELWGHKITSGDLRRAAEASQISDHSEGKD